MCENELENLYIKRQEIIGKIIDAEDKYTDCYNEWLQLYGEVIDSYDKSIAVGISNVQYERIKNDLKISIEEKERYEKELTEIQTKIDELTKRV